MKTTHLKVSAFLLGTSLVAMSCGESPPTSPNAVGPQANAISASRVTFSRSLDPSGRGSPINCSPLPEASDARRIGPRGGTLHVGRHTFTVPAGALDHYVVITAHASSGRYNVVHFEPEGLQFATPASLTISYANCDIPPGLLRKLLAYVDSNVNIVYYLESSEDAWEQTVTGQVNHFSDYAIAW